ncbi:G protein-coupled glucose receptor regulating Gpa2-domain-containing protein [Annulohypoxylon maeteangense]|uniref:G protein-coupled glucose receptor regulating Gpa2-domain-containing protein n=1 Tax=Annulohypoxylon maeteangense TaxID=1927788 RepID=UPI0020080C24|nr:G protein-coupled glucose receptor regulating Gpa2-domain-containing protein [Annulohypoxylon maeteangense]KAI0888754.1 G protein-coupled glucose receptor regulating Gpa2-domain-containing protein [Annulohypoxylon maeteangense]
MAPITWQPGANLAEIITTHSHGALFEKRDSTPSYMDNPEIIAIMSISLSMASISVLAALCAFYWFVRMRRSFRHDLIMLLIQSDMMKALWLVICPLAFFARVPIDSNSTFCQVSGFLLTVSIEASDIAVLLIAVHTALFILRPQGSHGPAGLYPYRRIAYTCWAIIPLVLAAVVPITGGQFADNGPHCYLPLRPTWYLSALSWIPRYVISAFIIVVYTVLYLYVACRFRSFTRDQRRASTAHSDHPEQNRKHHNHRHDHSGDVPPTPPIADYGFLDSARDSLANDGEQKDRQHSVDSTISTLDFGGGGASTPLPRRPDQVMRHSIRWNTVNFSNDGPTDSQQQQQQQQTRQRSQSGLISPASPSVEEASPIQTPEPAIHSPRSSQQSSRTPFIWQRSKSPETPSPTPPPSHSHTHSLTSSIHSVSNIICALRRGPPRPRSSTQSTANTTSTSTPLFLSPTETEAAMRRSREKQQRHLRLLFVYPAIYMVTWIAPFVSHVLQYDDDYADLNVSRGTGRAALQIVSVTSLCIGAAVDCCFFSAWEKPWQHLRGGFWENLALRLRLRRPAGGGRRGGAGRTREERFVDARAARSRREQEENLENLSSGAAVARRASGNGTQLGSPPREWWDVLDSGSVEQLDVRRGAVTG